MNVPGHQISLGSIGTNGALVFDTRARGLRSLGEKMVLRDDGHLIWMDG